jgi:Leucine-rich repeat (LRR) protein
MNRHEILEQLRVQSQSTYAQAKMKKLHEATANELAYTNTAAAGGAAGGGSSVDKNSIQFVLNTVEDLDFEIFLEVTENTSATINWGDGVVEEHEYLSNTGNTTSHDYAEVGEFTVKITFAEPTLVRELNFEGEGEGFATLLSITGLTNLTNLVELRADWNQLESIDLSGLTSLNYVDVSDNAEYGSPGLSTLNLSGCTALETLYADDNDFSGGFPDLTGLTSLDYIDFDGCGLIGTVNISGLPSLTHFDFSDNEGLTRIIISSTQPLGSNGEMLADNCALTQTSVDNILVALAANGIEGGYIDLRGGTNAIPSATGLTAITTLEGRGWSVDTNTP